MVVTKNIFKGKDYCWPTHTNSLLLDRKYTRGTEVFLTTINPGKHTHRHVHRDNEQLYIVLSGTGTIESSTKQDKPGRKLKVQKNEIVFIPTKQYHQMTCTSSKPLRYITVDIFPKGKPKSEPTWAAHAKVLRRETKPLVRYQRSPCRSDR